MMGRQLKVYLHADDHAAVEKFARDDIDAALVANRWPSASPVELSHSVGQGHQLFICPRSLLGTLRPRHVQAQGYWIVDPVREPLIEWVYAPLVGGNLYPGRFYYVPGNEQSGVKDEPFLRVADRLFRRLRTSMPWVETDWGRERLGPAAAERYERGEYRLRMNQLGGRT